MFFQKTFHKHLYFIVMCALSGQIFCKQDELVIIGGGIAGCMEAYYAHCDAQKNKTPLRIILYEQNKSICDTTVSHIVPSLTPDELLSVVPRGQELVKKMKILFSEPGGIRIDDVEGVHGSLSADQFQQEVQRYSLDEVGHVNRTQHLLKLGKMSMDLWQDFYDNADAQLQEILRASNFNPCHELADSNVKSLHSGYRIDLIYNVANAQDRALGMKHDYEKLGYKQCAILTPAEVKSLDPFLTVFCNNHSIKNAAGEQQWNNDSVAFWRPGGCIDTQVFLPKFYEYLKNQMGTYTSESGILENCLQIKYDKKVTQVDFAHTDGDTIITGLHFEDGTKTNHSGNYVFCPGESTGTLKKLGLQEPAYAGFAGAVLMLNIDIPHTVLKDYSKFSHCMEVHQEGVVLAWQARFRDNKIFIGVAGTKAFYGDQRPDKDQVFARNRNLLQLNMVNDVLPEFISWALKCDTKGKVLTEHDLYALESCGIATRWAGVRAVTYDGFPSLGCVYQGDNKVVNSRCTTHLGSGGVSFSHAAVAVSRDAFKGESDISAFAKQILQYGDSARMAGSNI